MVEIVERPRFTLSDFSGSTKKPGLSAIVPLRNEEEYAQAALDSILPFFDEIVIVYNDCRDRTPEIVAAYEEAHRDKVRAYHYVPRVFPRGSRGHRTTSVRDVRSLVHYFNFAVSRASYQVRCKWDGDEIADPAALGRVVGALRALEPGTPRWWLSPWRLGYWWYDGVNLWDYNGQLLVPKRRSLIGRSRDHFFWPAGRLIRYKRIPYTAYLFKRVLVPRYVGCLFYHVKGMKTDRGNTNSYFNENPDSLYRGRLKQDWGRDDLMTLEELAAASPGIRSLPHPSALGIRPSASRE
jgi:glycosyltransferase involved in cell wall biosynthesis